MSKKDKLKAQKEKQTLRERERLEEEKIAKEEANKKRSRSAVKMYQKAVREKNGKESKFLIIWKILMTAPFFYSVFFYGGVTVSGIFLKYMQPTPPQKIAWEMIIGGSIILLGIVFTFLKKYILSFILILSGNISFLVGCDYIVSTIKKNLENKAVDSAYLNMDKLYMQHYYPVLITLGISFILLILYIIRVIKKKKIIQEEKDNAPVKSIIDSPIDS